VLNVFSNDMLFVSVSATTCHFSHFDRTTVCGFAGPKVLNDHRSLISPKVFPTKQLQIRYPQRI